MGMSNLIKQACFAAALCVASASTALAGNTATSANDVYDITSVARNALASLQTQSFANNREYCGMVGRTSAGELIVSPARRGQSSGCNPRSFKDRSITPVASFHTHGAFHADADAEVPSVIDLDMDYAEKVLGFVATPGGRLWMTDYRSRTVTQICGLGCLPVDPNFKPGTAGEVPMKMTRREMAQREGIGGPKALRARHVHKH